jgi:iron complex outermembrane receptor protein
MLERKFSADLTDAALGLPNVVLDPAPTYSNGAAFAIRGLSFQDPDPTFEPAVGIVLDGVFLGKAQANLLDLYDVEQIEVLRGPQGTLFGKNTIGGLVNVRSRRPSGEFHARAQVTAGNYGRLDGRASIEAPLLDGKLAVKLAALSKHMEGYFWNEFTQHRTGEERSSAARFSAVYKPADNFDLTLVGDFIRDTGDTSAQNNASPGNYAIAQIGYPADQDGDLFRVDFNGDVSINSRTMGWMLEANWRLASHTVTSITGFRDADDTSATDVDGEPLTLFHYPRRLLMQQFSEELRVASSWSETLDYVAGVIFFRQWHHQRQSQVVDCALIAACPGVPPGVVAIPLDAVSRQHGDSYAVFAQANYRLTPRVRLTAGARYSWEEKDFSLFPPGYNLAPPDAVPFAHDKASFHKVTPKLGADFRPVEDMLLYASFSTGFKAGGYNGRANTVTAIGPYREEQVNAYEIGAKSEWLGHRLRANLAAFYNDYSDMQVEALVPSSAGSGQETLVRNVGTAYTAGVESEVTALLAPGLTMNVNVGYLQAKYTEFLADLGGTGTPIDNTFLKLRRAPRWTSQLDLSWVLPLGGAGNLTFNGGVNYTSEYETDVGNDAFARRPGAALLDAGIAYEPLGERYRISLFGRNLTDRRYINNGISAGSVFAFNEPNRPRVYGVDFSLQL